MKFYRSWLRLAAGIGRVASNRLAKFINLSILKARPNGKGQAFIFEMPEPFRGSVLEEFEVKLKSPKWSSVKTVTLSASL